MKKLIYLALILSLLLCCGPKQDKVERLIEDGVEVVINHLEPYKVEDRTSTLTLEQEMTIDTEKDEVAEIGLVDMETFDIDEEALRVGARILARTVVYWCDPDSRSKPS